MDEPGQNGREVAEGAGGTFLALMDSAGRLVLGVGSFLARAAGLLLKALRAVIALVAPLFKTLIDTAGGALVLALAVLVFATAAGSALAPSAAQAATMLSIGGLRIFWAVVAVWIAMRTLPDETGDRSRLLRALGYSCVVYLIALTPAFAFAATMAWAIVATVLLTKAGYSLRRVVPFVAAALAVAAGTVLARWIGEYLLLLAFVLRG